MDLPTRSQSDVLAFSPCMCATRHIQSAQTKGAFGRGLAAGSTGEAEPDRPRPNVDLPFARCRRISARPVWVLRLPNPDPNATKDRRGGCRSFAQAQGVEGGIPPRATTPLCQRSRHLCKRLTSHRVSLVAIGASSPRTPSAPGSGRLVPRGRVLLPKAFRAGPRRTHRLVHACRGAAPHPSC